MADSQHVAGKRQHRHRRHTSASENHDWEPRREESRHSVPYRTRQPEVQRSDRRRPKYSSHRSRASEDLLDTRSMPPARLLTRPTTSKPRGRRVYDHDADDDEENDDDSEKERLRGRLRSRSRSIPAWGLKSRATSRAKSRGVKSRPTSRGSQSTESITIPTPTRSSFVHIRSAPSAPSLGASSGSSSGDSDDDSSDSTQDYRGKTRTLKERMNGTPDSEPAANPASRSRSRHKSRDRIVPEIESATEDSEDQVISHRPRVVVKRSSMSRHRQAHQSRSPSRAPLHQRRSNRHSEEDVNFSSKRAHAKYYHSDVSYSEKPSFSRSRATSNSRMTSHSMGSSSKQPLGNFFQTSALPEPYDNSSKIHACVACREGKPTKKLTKLQCGHRWCRSCLKRRFKVSVEDAQNMPPKCCTSDIIPLKHVNDMFNDDFKRTWNEKYAKFSSRDRNYCPRSNCRARIRPGDHRHHSNGRTSATCRKCETEICGVCYKKWHESKHCPTDADTVQFLKVAKEAGWKRCFNCQAMVELKEGCNHMTWYVHLLVLAQQLRTSLIRHSRCGAQFCMICGSKWKACDCPSFNYHFNEEDDFNHVQIPVPMVSRERLGGTDGVPRGLRPGMAYTHEPQRYRGHRDEERARRLQHADEDDEDEDEDDDDYLNDMGDVMSMGNPAGHFMNGDYRRRSHSTIVPPVPPPAVPLPPASVTLERPKSGANYVSGVNKARGVRGSSMERRLADRFSEQRQTFNPHHRPFGQHVPPPTAPPLGMGMGPPIPHQAPMVPSPISRRHTMDDDMYDIPFDPRYAPPSLPRRATAHAYMDDFAVDVPLGRRRYRQMEPPRPSELAGLTGPGSGMNRVFEWRNHVDPYRAPDSQTVA
ncbi:hypothetical protein F4801DRAFT_580842 [Xylaria longipes]|nr:hypothetical protein F4801DRAFT_580842 [Xylaria longipes]